MDFAELMFYAEAEGMLPTRAGKINNIIKKIKAYPSVTIDEFIFESICNSCGINPFSLSKREMNYIKSSIR